VSKAAVFPLAAILLAMAFALRAGEDAPPPGPPEKPWRPFPEVQEVLFYEDFENPENIAEKGKVVADAPGVAPGGHTYELGEADWGKNEKAVWAAIGINKTKLKVPGGTNPNLVWVQAMFWTDESGDAMFKFKHGSGEYEDTQRAIKEKTWVPVVMRFSDLHNKNGRPEAEQVCNAFEVIFKPRDKKKLPKVYIDDIIITTNGVRPAEVLPRAMVARKSVLDLTRSVARDGFNYGPHSQEILKAALKAAGPRKKPKSAIVMGVKPADADDLIKGINAATAKIKATGFTLAAAAAPEGTVSGIDDMRTLLPYNLAKENVEYAVLAFGAADAMKSGRPSESVRIILDRTIAAGAIPIIVLAPSAPALKKEDKTKVDAFNNAVINVALQMGVTMIDPNLATKSAATAYENNELSAAGLEAVSGLAAASLKHIDANLFAKK
jgi:hypothetical protein